MNKIELLKSSVAVIACLTFALHSKGAEPPAPTIAWTGAANSLWNNAANWNPQRVPLASDHVSITGSSNFAVSLNVSASIASLALGADSGVVTQRLIFNNNVNLSCGSHSVVRSRGVIVLPNGDGLSISGAGLLEYRGVLDWTGGRLYGRTLVSPGGQVFLRGGQYMRLTSGVETNPAIFTNLGTVTWLGGERLYAYNDSRIYNLGRWELAADGLAIDHCCSGAGARFENSGTLVKTGGTNTSSMTSFAFINNGTVASETGTLEFSAGAASQWNEGGQIAGPGRVLLNGGNATLSGRTTLKGRWEWTSDSLNVYGNGSVGGPVALDWTAGQVIGALTVAADGRLNLRGAAYMRLASGVNTNPAALTNHGLVVFSGGNRLLAYYGAQVFNHGEWRMDADGLAFEYCCAGNGPTFHNYGLLNKSGGSGESTFDTSTTINYSGGIIRAGTGTMRFNSSTEWRDGGRVGGGAGRVLQASGNANLLGNTILDGSWQWGGANITGTGSISGPVALTWRNARLYGNLTIQPGGNLEFTGEYYPSLDSGNIANPAILTNRGTVTWAGGIALYGAHAPQIYNYNLWRLNADGTAVDATCCGGGPTFHNFGTLAKTGGTNDTLITSSHTINHSNATVNAASGTLRFNTSTEWRNGGQITGAGRVWLNGGNAQINGTTALFGSWQWGGVGVSGTGAISGPIALVWRNARLYGNLTIQPGGNLEFTGEYYPSLDSGNIANPAILTNRGTVTWAGGNPLYGAHAPQIYNYSLWRVIADGTALAETCCGGGPTFHNYGTLAKTGGTNDTLFTQSLTINNSNATVNAASGTLRFDTSTEWRNGGQITGTGRVLLNNGNAQINGTTALLGSWQWAGVTVSGSGAISGPLPLIWRHGRLTGNLTVEPGARLDFTGEYYPLLDGTTANPAILTNRGIVTWSGGNPLYGAHAPQIHNYGLWQISGEATALAETCCGGGPTFHNHGTFRKTGANTTTMATVGFVNNGRITTEAGQLNFNLPPTNPGEFHFPLRGTTAGVDYGTIRVPNNYLTAGTVRAEPTNGYTPLSGHSFDLVTGNGLRGGFNPVLLPSLPPDLGWTVDYYSTVTRFRVTDACLADGLVGWWPADGGAGDMTSFFNGTLANGTFFTTGIVNQAFSFDGVDDHVNLGGWNPGTRWTLQTWVKLRQVQTGRRGILGGMGDARDWSLVTYNGALGVTYKPLSGSSATLTNTIIAQTNTWYHLAGTFNGSNVALYVNGMLIGTAPADPDYVGTTSGTRIGGSTCCGEYFAGAVDEATIHNRPLSQTEILNTYNQGAAGRCAGLGLSVLSFTPGGLVTSNVSRFTIRFNQPFNTNTFTTADLAVNGPAGAVSAAGFAIAPDPSFDGRTFVVTLPPLTQQGGYTVNIGPNIESVSGQNMTGGVFTALFTIDKTGPRVIAFTPSSTISNQVTTLEATFSETISAASVQASDVTIAGPNAPSVVGFTQLASNVFRFNLNRSLTQGSNSIVVGPGITDLAGNLMDQNNNGMPGEAVVDAYTISLQVETPDLTVAAINTPAVALAGQAATLIYTVTNAGTAPAAGGWRAEFRLAQDSTGTNSTFLGTAQVTNSIAANASLTLTQNLVMPQGLAGIRYLGVRLDALDQVPEQNETNNVAWSPTGTAISAPDLVVSNLVANSSAILGSAVTVQWTRVNIGTAATFVPGDDRLFLSVSSTSIVGARLLATVPGAVLNAGESLSRTQSVTIPLETTLPAGSYFIVVAIDSPDSQPESNEGNNRASAALTLSQPQLPDLAMAEFVPPTKLFPGALMSFNWTVTNRGSLGLTNGVWRERVSFSNSVVGLVTLADITLTNTLTPAGSIVRTQQVFFPAEFPTDPGFLFITLDYYDDIIEQTEANNVVRSDSVIPVAYSLRLTFSSASITEGTNTIIGTVHRNGDNSTPLTVTLSNDFPARLMMTNEVTIAAGTESATFVMALPDNSFIDGTVFAHGGATASNYLSGFALLQLVDESRRALSLTLATNETLEGLTVAATVSRGLVETQDLVVFIGAFDPLSLTVPFSVTIPAGAASVVFAVLATDDSLFNGWRTNLVRAGASGLDEAHAALVIRDDDLPAVTLELSPQSVPENAGSQAANLSARLSAPASRNVVLDLISSAPDRARVPIQMSILAGQLAASVPVSVSDNLQLGSNASVQFQGFVRESGSTRQLASTPIVLLQILDDESPALRVALDKDLVAEGLAPAASGTVSRTGSTASSLVVQLASSDTTEVFVPVSVTIAAGANSAPFVVNSLQDNTTDGSQRATISATATGYTGGSADLTVSDQDLPDLRVVNVVGPLTALAEDNFTMSYRVENQGRVTAGSNLVTKVYLRTDPLAFGGTVVGTYTLANGLPPGQFFEQSLAGRFPRNLGTYYLVVQTDTDGRNVETLENNNTLVSAPIQVSAPWTATVQTPVTSAVAGTLVPMTGTATRPGGATVANTVVSIQVVLDGMKRTIGALTDSSGNFSATFTPFAREAGNYTIAAGHPGVEFLAPQDSFSLLGMSISPSLSRHHILEGQVVRGVLSVSNLSSIPLSGLNASVVSQPPGWNTTLALTNNALAGNGDNTLHFVVTPNSSGIANIIVRITSAEGVTMDAQLEVAVEPLRAKLVATPGSLFSGMVRGEQTIVRFDLVNAGGAVTGPIAISLPTIPWLSSATPSPLPPLAPGESNSRDADSFPADEPGLDFV